MGICHPSKALVALGTVCGNGEIVGAHSPYRIGNEFIDGLVSGNHAPGFHFLCN